MKKIIAAFLLLFSCNNPAQNPTPSVLVTVPPYAYFVQRIAGDAVHVEVLVPPGANPHIYEPSPKQVQKILGVQVWFRLEEPVEQKILTVLKEQSPALKEVSLSQGIELISAQDHVCGLHHAHESQDRHIWMSPKLAEVQAKTILDALSTAYPAHQEAFQKGFEGLIRDLETLDQGISAKLKPFHGDAILVSHPAFGYYCQEFGLEQLSIECEGKDPLPQDIARTLSEAERKHVRGVFTQAQYNNKGAILIAEKLRLPIYSVDPYSSDYIENLNHITDLIAHD
jgi:zinc transport system substrate-binding protein